jgi:hypothetical protein
MICTAGYEWEDLVIPCLWAKQTEGAWSSHSSSDDRVPHGDLLRVRKTRRMPRKTSQIRRIHLIMNPMNIVFNPLLSVATKHVVSINNIGSKDLAFRVTINNPRLVARPEKGFICTGTKQRLMVIAQPSDNNSQPQEQGSRERIVVEAAEVISFFP